MMGGTNTSTGQAFKGMMKAPPGSTVVTPLTTLVAELVKPGVSVQQAEQKVVAALGLSSGSKLINMDPIKEAAVDSATFKAHQTVAMLANDVTSKLLNATGNTNKASEFGDDIASAVFKQIAKQIESAPPASPKILDASSISNTAGALIEGLANEKALGAVSLSQAMAINVIAAKAAVQVSITEAASALQKAPTKLEPSALKTLVDEQAKLQASTLVNGVASGEATQNSAVLWARSLAIGELSFELGTKADFSGDLKSVKVEVIDPSIPVKAPISGLKASTEYFYRVKDAGGDIKTGRFTTPADLGVAKGLTFGASGDWRGELSPFPAVSNADEKRLDFFVLLGDTIYADYPSPDLNKPQAESLADFRAKHGEVYRSKAGLNALGDLRGSTAVWATIDDHEVTNDFAGGHRLLAIPDLMLGTRASSMTQRYTKTD